jgi:hypothetical protein
MNESTRVMKIGNSARWRNWARSLACQAPARRRSPIALALVRRTRSAAWIAQQTTVHQHIAGTHSILLRPVIQLSLHGPSPVERILLRAATLKTIESPAQASEERSPSTSAIQTMNLLHRRTARVEERTAQIVWKEIVERTRRIEDRISVRTKLAKRGGAPDGAPNRAQTAIRPDGPDWWKGPSPAYVPSQPALPAMNMDQITETVLRQLDRRVGAWRERMGRA